jgi:hypothetical protein
MPQPLTPAAAPPLSQRRRIHYVDRKLQMRLLLALVVLEIVVLSVAGWVLYHRLDTLVEESIYRVHHTAERSMFASLLSSALQVVAGMLAANVLALLVAKQIWSAHVNRILGALGDELDKARRLDFSAGAQAEPLHPVVVTAQAWRAAERQRHVALREALDAWGRALQSETATDEERRAALLACRRPLPARKTT